MNIAFTKNKDVGFNPQLHDDHPIHCVEIGESDSYSTEDGKTWYVMTKEQYEAHKVQMDVIWAEVYANG
jgi:translation elongation factor P/translation initiation factor 5A